MHSVGANNFLGQKLAGVFGGIGFSIVIAVTIANLRYLCVECRC